MSGMFSIHKGLKIDWQNQVWVLDKTINAKKYQFEALETGEYQSIDSTEFFAKLKDKSIRILEGISNDIEINYEVSDDMGDLWSNPKDAMRLRRKLEYVTALEKEGISRGKRRLVLECISRTWRRLVQDGDSHKKPSPETVRRWSQLYEESGKNPAVLLDRNRTRKTKFTPHEFELADQAIQEVHMQRGSTTYADVHNRLQYLCFLENKARPPGTPIVRALSPRHLRRRIEAIPAYDRVAARIPSTCAYSRRSRRLPKLPSI